MKLTLSIELDNAAFDDDLDQPDEFERSGSEVARILRGVVGAVDMNRLRAGDHGTVADCNGNTVCRWEVIE